MVDFGPWSFESSCSAALARRLTVACLAAFALCASPLSAEPGHELSGHLLEGSFRGAALRGLLPERILSGREQPEARASGDLTGNGGQELAVAFREEDSVVLILLRQKDGGAWARLADFKRDVAGVTRMQFLTLSPGAPQLLLVHWFLGGSVLIGQLEIFTHRSATDSVESVLLVPASSFRLEDVDEDGAPELIASRDSGGVPGVPEVYRWDGHRFVTTMQNLSKFHASAARRFQAKGENLVRQTPRSQQVGVQALDNLLNAARCLEQAGHKDDAFRAYRRVASLSRSSLIRPRKADSLQPLRDLRAQEARAGMARLLEKPPKSESPSPQSSPALSIVTGSAGSLLDSTAVAPATTQ